MIRTIGLALSAIAITASTLVACNKHDNKPELTTVIKKPSGECIGWNTCPPRDEHHITGILEPSEVTGTSPSPTVSLSPTVTEVPTLTPSPTSTDVLTTSPTP